jgi:hypothetical protein
MKKNHIIFVAVVIALWAGFMAYRHFKGKGDVEKHHAAEQGRITEAAKKSPRAGLAQMGSALQRYYDDNNAYPPTLNELHPKYVANKSFIDDLDWYYTRQRENFFLSKTVITDNKRMVASVDKSLMPRVETGVMVAAPTPTPEPAEVKTPEAPITGIPEITIQSREEFWEALRRRELDKGAQPLPQKRTSATLLARRPKIISVIESDVVSEAEREVSQRYLVWKDNNGTLGFGDAQFPAATSRTIYEEGNWYDMTIPMPKEMVSISSDTEPVGPEVDPGEIASNMGERYLVWKGEQGTLGFGNIEYPEKDRVSVFAEDDWVSVEKLPSAAKTVGEEEYTSTEEKTPEAVASELSTEYLVWKDKETLGVGNVAYPETGQVSAYEEDEWVGVERPALPQITAPEKEYAAPEGLSPETVPSEISAHYLVWKDKHGNLGFGNIAYPETGQVSAYEEDEWVGVERPALAQITAPEKEYAAPEGLSPETVPSEITAHYLVWKDQHGNLGFGNVVYPETGQVSAYEEDEWVGVERPALPQMTAPEKEYAASEGPSPETVPSEISAHYLVWKDEHGNLGFGNVGYPSNKEVSYVHVDGNWQKIMN